MLTWGLLVKGRLRLAVLPANQAMNRFAYADSIGKRFGKWISDALGSDTRPIIIQDYERCFWTHEPREAWCAAGLA